MNRSQVEQNEALGGRASCEVHMYSSDAVNVARLAPVMESMCFCTFFADYHQQIFYFSRGLTDAVGLTGNGPMLLPDFLLYVSDNDRAETARKYGEYFAAAVSGTAGTITFRHSLHTADAGTMWLQVHMQFVQDGDRHCIWGAILDRTQNTSERILSQMLTDGIDECIYYYDMVTDICCINSHFMNILNLKTNYIENASRRVMDFIHPDDYSRARGYFKSYINHENDELVGDFRLITGDGNQIWMHASGLSDFDVSGSIRYITGIFVDITDKVKTASLHKNFIESSSDVIFKADLGKDHIEFFGNFQQILPDAPLAFSGNIVERITEYIHPDDRRCFVNQVEQILSDSVSSFSFDFRLRRPDSSEIWLAVRGKSFRDIAYQSQMAVGTIVNLSDMSYFSDILEKSAGRNEVTDLPVRKRLVHDLEKVICDRNIQSAAIILIDIREFHTYNDRFGRATGDEILRGISNMITERLPDSGSLYHINVDHFCILWPHAWRVQVENFMIFLQSESAKPIVIRKENVFVAYAMSAALFPSCGNTADELLVNAEITLNKVKREKRKHYSIFIPSDKKELTEKLDFESQLSKSVLNTQDNFLLYYQPLFDAQSETLIGAEALLRWISPNEGIISPERVIAALEATGHMDGVGAWVLEQGIYQCSKWLREGVNPAFVLHVNITAEDLMRPNYSLSVISLLAKYSLNPGNLILEITETSLMRSISLCRQNLIRLRKAGIKISLDDFGTGYSSLNYLRELPVDEIKIDRAFLENIRKDRYNHSFISAMIILAHSIPRNVCIEGIETNEQAETVRALHADVFQGFFFGRPVSAPEFELRFLSKPAFRT